MDTNVSEEQNNTENLSNEDKEIKALYAELADKEQALILAAQFGNNLIEEKENLERLMESNKQDQLIQIEAFEQESYELKRQIESMRNEYEAKIYELNEDLHMMSKKLKENDEDKTSQKHDENEQFILIQELLDKNKHLSEEIRSNEMKYNNEAEKTEQLELKLQEKEQIQNENTRLLNSFEKEINKLLNKQQELEMAYMQTCNERDKQAKLIDELTKKYLFIENEKNEIEHLVFQHENEIFNLRRINQDLIYKFEKIELHSNALNRKRRSNNKDNNSNNSAQLNSIKSHLVKNLNLNESIFFNEDTFSGHQNPFRQIENSSFYHHDESDNQIFKMDEIEEDEVCRHLDDIEDDADESVDMFKNSAFLDNESNENFLTGAINWQQEAIEQEINNENDIKEAHESDTDISSIQNDNSNYIQNESKEDDQHLFRNDMEDDSNNSLN